MVYRSKPIFMQPDSWKILAIIMLVLAVLNGAMFGWSLIYGSPSPENLIIAVTFSIGGVASLLRAKELEK